VKILVTGGAGFIGSHVAEAFHGAGHQVLAIDDLSSGARKNLPPEIAFEELDILSETFGQRVLDYKPDAIAHLAAQIDLRKSINDPAGDAEVNIIGSVRMLQAASQAGTKKIIFSSTGGAIYGEQDEFPATEAHACRPVSPYGTAKLCVEHYLGLFLRTFGLAYAALRYSNVYGPRQDPYGEAGVVAIFVNKLLKGERLVINGDGLQTRDFVYVKDVARANLLALAESACCAINIGTGIETSINKLAEILSKHTGLSGEFEHGPAKKGEQLRSSLNASFAEGLMAWHPQVSLDQGLCETVGYFRENSHH